MVWAIDFRSLTGNILKGVHSGPPTRMSSKMGEALMRSIPCNVHYFITDSKAEKWSEGSTGLIKLTGEYDDYDIDTALSDDDSPIMDIERDFYDIEQRINMGWPNPMED